MLPKPDNGPTLLAQQPAVSRIPSAVALDFGFPFLGKLVSPFGKPPAVPEVTINEDRDLHEAEYEIRTAWKVAGVALPFEAPCGQSTRDQEFRVSIPAANPCHHPRTGFRGHD